MSTEGLINPPHQRKMTRNEKKEHKRRQNMTERYAKEDAAMKKAEAEADVAAAEAAASAATLAKLAKLKKSEFNGSFYSEKHSEWDKKNRMKKADSAPAAAAAAAKAAAAAAAAEAKAGEQ
jgi:hypothetical protein